MHSSRYIIYIYIHVDFEWRSTVEEYDKGIKIITYIFWSWEIENIESKVNIIVIKRSWNHMEHLSSELIYM